MKSKLISIQVLLCVVTVGCQHVGGLDTPCEATEDLSALLDQHPNASALPELGARTVSEWAGTERGQSILAWAAEARETTTIPETTYTRYRIFRRTGERPPYQTPYFGKRGLLTQEVLAAWLGQDDSNLDRVNDLLWSICEETTWVVPAHEKEVWTIDLFCAETAADLAHALLLLGDRLPEEIRDRVRHEIKARVLDRYLEHGRDYWWDVGRNNWTGVCAGSIGQTFLLLEDDPVRQAKALALVIEQLGRFMENGFEEDGGCLEGVGYWNYGLIHFVGFSEMLRARTGGKIDLLAQEKVRRLARYPLAALTGPDSYASFADSHEHSSLCPFLAARLAERTGEEALLALVGGVESWRLTTVLRNLLWWDGHAAPMPPLEDNVLPVSGVGRVVSEIGDVPIVLVAKAGSNGEPHNHNDVGSFVLRIGDQTYLCDPGSGLYNKDYFSAKRYENVLANSYGHSVPRIDGELQGTGDKYTGRLSLPEQGCIEIDFEDAYPVSSLQKAHRKFTLSSDGVFLEDSFVFGTGGGEVEEAFVTWRDVDVEGSVARVKAKGGVLEIRLEGGVFAAEPLDEACRANHKSDTLTRLSVDFGKSAETVARFHMVFHPVE